MKRKTAKRQIIGFMLSFFILMNVVAFFHAYKFTHFAAGERGKTQSPEKLFGLEKVKTLFFGVNNPRPENTVFPSCPLETIKLQSNKEIEIWCLKADSSKGTVILFHGYGESKSSMIDKSDEFLNLGYNSVLVDFMGSGGSEGNQTTIGYREAEEVKTVFDFVYNQGEKNIYLFGTSLGAVAILKSISDYNLSPKGIIIECPFGSMYQTVSARFRNMNVPSFPMAGLLLFWGGIRNGFWTFGHNPVDYANKVTCPALLLYGERDRTDSHDNLKGGTEK